MIDTAYALPDGTAEDGEPIGSTAGYHAWCNYAMARAEQYPEAAHFGAFEWTDRPPDLESDLERILHECGDPDLSGVSAQLLAALRATPDGAAFYVPAGEQDDGPAAESLVREHGSPPFPGAVLGGDPPRWHNPRTGEEHPNDPDHPHDEHEAASTAHASLPAKAKAAFAAVRSGVEEKLKQSKGGRVVLAMGQGGAWLFHAIEHRLLYVMHKTQEVAVEAAKQRGLPEEKLPALKRALYVADFLGGYATGAAGLAVAGALGAKVGSLLPSASVAYLAYSTARDPAASWKAAKTVIARTFERSAKTHESAATPELAGLLADRLRDATDPDWYLALFHAALATTEGDVRRAVEMAASAIADEPNGPEGVTESILREHFGRTEEGWEWVSESAYELLTEAARVGLTKKQITNKNGKQQTVWVRADTGSGSERLPRQGGAEEAIAAAFKSPKALTAEEVAALDAHLKSIPKERLRQLALAAQHRIGPTKAAIAARLLEHVRSQRDDGAGRNKAPKKATKQTQGDARKAKAETELASAIRAAASAPLTIASLANLVDADSAAMTSGVDTGGALTGEGSIGRVLDAASADAGDVRRHGMSAPEKCRQVTIEGIDFQWPDTPEGRTAAAQSLAMLARGRPLPPKLWAANRQIVLTSQRSKDDPYWEQRYNIPGFVSTASGGDGGVVVYNGFPLGPSVLAHEAGHNLAKQIWGATTPDPNSEYGRAQQQEPPVTWYGQKSPSEDFAEAVSMYTGADPTRAELKADYPLKFAALEKILGPLP